MESFLTNDELIAAHRNQINPVPFPDHTLTFAHENFRYEKMAKELQTKDDILRTKILIEVNEDLRQGFHVMEILSSGVPAELIRAMKEDNDTIRELASRTMIQFAWLADGRQYLVEQSIINDIVICLDDRVEKIRKNAYDSLLHLSKERYGCEGVVAHDVIRNLIDKLLTEKVESLLQLTLQLIKLLLNVEHGPPAALKVPSISRLRNLMTHRNPDIRRLSAENIGSLSFAYPGKKRTIEEGCVNVLGELLKDEVSEVRTLALRALASMTIEKSAKVQLIEGDYLNSISKLLYDESMQTRLNVVQLISNVGEHPLAKIEFQNNLEKLRQMVEEDEEIVKRFTERTIHVLTWTP